MARNGPDQKARPRRQSTAIVALLLVAAFGGYATFAQSLTTPSQQSFVLSGKVQELGLATGVDAVVIVVERYDGKVESSLSPKQQIATLTTGVSGAFSLPLVESGTYRITVQKDGYVAPGGALFGSTKRDRSHRRRNQPISRTAVSTGSPCLCYRAGD